MGSILCPPSSVVSLPSMQQGWGNGGVSRSKIVTVNGMGDLCRGDVLICADNVVVVVVDGGRGGSGKRFGSLAERKCKIIEHSWFEIWGNGGKIWQIKYVMFRPFSINSLGRVPLSYLLAFMASKLSLMGKCFAGMGALQSN